MGSVHFPFVTSSLEDFPQNLSSPTKSMKWLISICVCVLALHLVIAAEEKKEEKKVKRLQIGVKKRVDPEKCKMKSKKGDVLKMHYTGKLEDGSQFDSSHSRNEAFEFTLGAGQVIKGWDQGLLGMCEGEKRKLVIPPDMGYGSRGAPPKIPGEAVLIFEVELLKIDRKEEL